MVASYNAYIMSASAKFKFVLHWGPPLIFCYKFCKHISSYTFTLLSSWYLIVSRKILNSKSIQIVRKPSTGSSLSISETSTSSINFKRYNVLSRQGCEMKILSAADKSTKFWITSSYISRRKNRYELPPYKEEF